MVTVTTEVIIIAPCIYTDDYLCYYPQGCDADKGDTVTGVVMYVDMSKCILDVILNDDYVSFVQSHQSTLDCHQVSLPPH